MIPSGGRLQGYLAGRSAVLAVLLVCATVVQARQGGAVASFFWFFVAAAAAFGFTFASAVALRRDGVGPLLCKLQPAWDVAFASALVFLSGGALSPFSTAYFLSIIGGAILLFRTGALVAATASSLAYGLLVDLQYYGIVAPLSPFPLPEAEGTGMVVQLLLNLVAFYAVALLSGYLADELRRTGERLEEAQAEVLNLEHLKASILENLGSGLIALDPTGREVFHNRVAAELLERVGRPLGEGMNVNSLFPLTRQERNEAYFAESRVTFGYTVTPLRGQGEEAAGNILIFQDLSKLKRLEEELRRSDRLAAVGRLAAGLAHEIRNPLASLSGSVEVLRDNLNPGPDEHQLFAIVLRETERLNRLVTNFLHYARPDTTAPAAVDVAALVDDTAFFFLHGEGRTGFHLDNRVSPEARVAGNRAQLEQLFLNLFRNSREAAPDEVRVVVAGAREGDEVVLLVRDDGPGMPRDVAERAFEPFFSNKEGGVGLGLATVHRIVENHGGSVVLETEPGKGTAFTFRLPAARDGDPGSHDGQDPDR